MKKFILMTSVAMLCLGTASESRAVDCPTGKKVCQTGCIDKSLTCNSCGPTCGYTQVGGGVTLYGTGEAVSGYEWKYVNGIAGYYDSDNNPSPFRKNTSITSVKADSTSNFTSIGENAFYNATSLESVDLSNVTSIGDSAFNGATSLQSVDMPNVTSLGTEAFAYATSLQSVDLSNVTSIGNNAFFSATSLQSVDLSNVNTIGNDAFANASSLSYVELNPNISSDKMGSNAFFNTAVRGCGTGDSYVYCNYCTNRNANRIASINIYNNTTIYQPNANGGSCIAANECSGDYVLSGGLCKKNTAQVAQNTQQGTGTSTSSTTTASCPNGASIGGECFPRRYTPAEIAELVGESNTILLYYK